MEGGKGTKPRPPSGELCVLRGRGSPLSQGLDTVPLSAPSHE